jgi:hypothetical protein
LFVAIIKRAAIHLYWAWSAKKIPDQIQSLENFCREREAWRQIVGLTEIDDREMRNTGERRTLAKRELLRRIVERSSAAGIEPFSANYQDRRPSGSARCSE